MLANSGYHRHINSIAMMFTPATAGEIMKIRRVLSFIITSSEYDLPLQLQQSYGNPLGIPEDLIASVYEFGPEHVRRIVNGTRIILKKIMNGK